MNGLIASNQERTSIDHFPDQSQHHEQGLDLHNDTFTKEGCDPDTIFTNRISEKNIFRPGLELCLKELNSGDTLIACQLDRFERSMSHLTELIELLVDKGIDFRSIQYDAIDTTTTSSKLIFNIYTSALAKLKRLLAQKWTQAGLNEAWV